MSKGYSLVLTGGGARGAVQVGMLRALLELDVEVAEVIGTSVGAINGSWFAYEKDMQDLEELWITLTKNDVFPANPFRYIKGLTISNHLVSNKGLLNAIKLLPNLDLRQSKKPITVMTTKLSSGESVPHKSGNLQNLVLASCSIPGVFPPVVIDKEEHVDGCVTALAPYEFTNKKISQKTIVLDASGSNVVKPRTAIDVYRMGFNHSMRKSIKEPYISKNLTIISPKTELFIRHDGRSFEKTKDLFEIGYQSMLEHSTSMQR
ncbi:MAG: patatin-like phospholipase family protein [Candidatus Paceibacterota bacterium]